MLLSKRRSWGRKYSWLKEYRENNNHGSVVVDFRLDGNLQGLPASVLYQDIFNEECMGSQGIFSSRAISHCSIF